MWSEMSALGYIHFEILFLRCQLFNSIHQSYIIKHVNRVICFANTQMTHIYVLAQWFGYESCWLGWLCMCRLRICRTYYPGLWLSGPRLQQQTWLDLLLSLGLCLKWFHITQTTLRYRQYSVSDLAESLISSYRHILGYFAGQSFKVERNDELYRTPY